MYDLLLIKPLSSYNLQYTPPLGLGFIANYVKKNGFTVRIFDCNVLGVLPEELFKHILIKDYRFIGFQAFDMDLGKIKEYVRAVRKESLDIPIIIGGPAPSSNPKSVFNLLKEVNFLVVGEGEVAVVRLLELFNSGRMDKSSLEQIPNLAWRENDEILVSHHEYVEDLDAIGSPDWDELNPRLYGNAVHGFFYRRLPVLPIMISRGCPYRCSFCGSRNITGYKVRRRDPVSVVDELEYLKNKYGLREFQVIDDNFTFPNSAALEFANELIKRRLDLLWTCPNGLRLDTLDEKLLVAMKESGCYEVAVGIESGDPEILKDIGKGISLEMITEKIKLIYAHGIDIIGFVMVGYPLETLATLRRTIKFVSSLPLVRISLTRFIPLPGTPITDRLIASGEISEKDIISNKMQYGNFSYIPPKLTDKQLRYWYRWFFLRFYLRPKIILHNLRNIRTISHASIILQKIISFFR
ncbi:MAG: radical SAM protein [Candidatus Omnitrophota bacterium]|nr:radical SAM protein [Candidatus Omnitrophota bacterium]